jgi:hypothetical protein
MLSEPPCSMLYCWLVLIIIIIIIIIIIVDRLCDLVVRVSGYRSRSPGSIPGATRVSEK